MIDPNGRLSNKLITNKSGEYSKRMPKEIYDSSIVTLEGERIFSPWDDYAAELLLTKRNTFKELPIMRKMVLEKIKANESLKHVEPKSSAP